MKLILLESFWILDFNLRAALAPDETNREPHSWEVKPPTLGRLALKCTACICALEKGSRIYNILTAVHELPHLSDSSLVLLLLPHVQSKISNIITRLCLALGNCADQSVP